MAMAANKLTKPPPVSTSSSQVLKDSLSYSYSFLYTGQWLQEKATSQRNESPKAWDNDSKDTEDAEGGESHCRLNLHSPGLPVNGSQCRPHEAQRTQRSKKKEEKDIYQPIRESRQMAQILQHKDTLIAQHIPIIRHDHHRSEIVLYYIDC